MMTGSSANEMMSYHYAEKPGRAMEAVLQMNKIDIAELRWVFAR